eukprot:3112191-Rhodomonas_salina.1
MGQPKPASGQTWARGRITRSGRMPCQHNVAEDRTTWNRTGHRGRITWPDNVAAGSRRREHTA